MKKSEIIKAVQEVLREKKRPGLWANIRAKKARGEKPAHKNSNAHKDAVKAGKKINKSETNEGKSYSIDLGNIKSDDLWMIASHLKDATNKGNNGPISDLVAQAADILEDTQTEGLWANINAKKKAGKKPAHGNSNAHKDAVAAGKRIKKES